MPSFDSIVVGEDWISEHYFTTDSVNESFHGKVLGLRKTWDAEAKEGRSTVRSTLLSAARDLQTALAGLSEDPLAAPKAHAQVRAAFGYQGELTPFTAERAGSELEIPDAQLPDLPDVLFLQAEPVDTLEDLLAPETGRLITPATEDGKPIESASKAVSAAFRSDTPPAFVVVQAGQWLLLAEAERWAEGRYLAMDLLVVVERRHEARGGEIDRAAALFGYQSLKADADGNIWWTGVLEDSVKHTVGVSKDLREGIRLSIEIIANEVVRRRAERGLTMDGIDGNELAKHSLRFLYRILFLLYAEASPEMQVLPTGAAEYEEGYGLDRLRELTLTELVSHRARTGTHLYDSLKKLFDLVDRGHTPTVHEHVLDDPAPGLEFNPLRADLFSPKATALIDEVGLGNAATQQVLEHLLLTKESKGRKGGDRGFISYAELGINQLGAVYEGLMSYTGFFAEEDLYEVAKDGNPEKGSWVVPVHRADHLSESDFVRAEDLDTHELKPVIHREGTFVFRLAGRERQQSASYYTPEVLTKFVVSQALEELLDQNGTETTPEEILQLTICEPALGSGAFAIEAVRQLAAEYLKRKQNERNERIEADQYAVELQKVKAHIALHQVYGVDLNATAVELAEISLWLDTMVAGLQAPWFGLHLRRGNSLIGARRAVYMPNELAKKAWLKSVPKDVPLGTEVGAGIHHFLLPAEGWGAVVDTSEAKTYAPEKREELRLWRNEIRKSPTKDQVARLQGLAQRVETLWDFALRRLTIAESEIRRDIQLWGSEPSPHTPAVTREQVEKVLHNPDGVFQRLRRAMDAWCALWSWPLTSHIAPPSWDSWLGGLEAILGQIPHGKTPNVPKSKAPSTNQMNFVGDLDWDGLDEAEEWDLSFAGARPIETALHRYPWLTVAGDIAKRDGYFQWELDFASVFARGGFDLQVGNPPWVRPDWDEAGLLAEYDPWWQLAHKPSEAEKRQRAEEALALPEVRQLFLDERAAQAAQAAHLGSSIDRPALTGLQPDMYRCFMERTWRSAGAEGIVSLIHPESHFTEARAQVLRRATYRRLKRHWQFRNELSIFSEINHTRQYGVHVYGSDSPVRFLQGSALYHPDVPTRSLKARESGYEPTGIAPGVKDPDGKWDVRPHPERIIEVTENELAAWAALVDEPGTPTEAARMLYPVNRASAAVLDKIAAAPRLGDVQFEWTAGWHESADRKLGYFESRSAIPATWGETILQGPHLTVATPIHQQGNPTMRSNVDYSAIDLESIPETFIPRTNYQVARPLPDYLAAYPKWDGEPSSNYARLAWREMCDSATVRTLHTAILPPGPSHVGGILSLSTADPADLAVMAAFTGSIVGDFLIKVMGVGHVKISSLGKIPHVRVHVLEQHLIHRVLRLNALVSAYRPLWAELYNPGWTSDAWTPGINPGYRRTTDFANTAPEWTWHTPLRTDADRRQALIEIDAIVAVMLDITADELLTIYRTQFPVLQKYEREALYDANGRQIPSKLAAEYRQKGSLQPSDVTADGITYTAPFNSADRERDMILAHSYFTSKAEHLRAAPILHFSKQSKNDPKGEKLDRVTGSMVQKYVTSAGLDHLSTSDQFEHFAGSLLLRSEMGYNPETSIQEHLAGPGVQGYDLFAAIVNGEVITDRVDLELILERCNKITVELIFAQFKTSSTFKIGDFSNFVDVCRTILSNTSDIDSSEFPALDLISAIYEAADSFKENPRLSLFYVTTSGAKIEKPIERKRADAKAEIESLSLTSSVTIECLGSSELQRRWRELDQGITRTFLFERKTSMPGIDGVEQAYIGMLPAKELLSLVTAEGAPSKIVKSIFYDNVRDYQGHVDVNVKILETLQGPDSGKFAVLNNGVTIIAKEITPTGDSFKLSDYQIVNGCQTVHVLHEASIEAGDAHQLSEVFVPVKVIATRSTEVARNIAQATNQQTQVSPESLLANSDQQKRIEEYFNSVEEHSDSKLFYERRLKQWTGNNTVVGAWRVITIRQMIRSFASMFLQQPHTANRYYNNLRDQAEERVFRESIPPAFHWTAALLFCRIEFLFRNGKIDPELKPIKFHIMAAITRAYMDGRITLELSDAAAEKSLTQLQKIIQHEEELVGAILECSKIATNHHDTKFNRDFCRTQESAIAFITEAASHIRRNTTEV